MTGKNNSIKIFLIAGSSNHAIDEVAAATNNEKNNEIKIDFKFKNLVSPYEVLESPDSRKLGILVKNIAINPI